MTWLSVNVTLSYEILVVARYENAITRSQSTFNSGNIIFNSFNDDALIKCFDEPSGAFSISCSKKASSLTKIDSLFVRDESARRKMENRILALKHEAD